MGDDIDRCIKTTIDYLTLADLYIHIVAHLSIVMYRVSINDL